MKARIEHKAKIINVDFLKPLDISLVLSDSDKNLIAWYLDKPEITPVIMGDWVGKVSEGKSSTNFNNVFFNPHGHGTHTECLGHITKDFYSITDSLTDFFFLAELVSVTPEVFDGDAVINKAPLQYSLGEKRPEAIVIRTLPNDASKKSRKYSNTNPAYISEDAALWLREIGVKHLLTDLPSVDKEHDEGKLLAHKAFWNVTDVRQLNADARLDATITELIYVPDEIPDGSYLLNLQVMAVENDAGGSRPVLFEIFDL